MPLLRGGWDAAGEFFPENSGAKICGGGKYAVSLWCAKERKATIEIMSTSKKIGILFKFY